MGPPRSSPGGPTLLAGMKRYSEIPVAALFLVSGQSPGRWADASTDPMVREKVAALRAILERQAKSIEDGLPSARVVRLPSANHYVFLSNEADVVREVRAFVGSLR